MLRLPRNLHFEVHKVLYLSRNLHFEVHKVLHLPRNLHIEGHRVLYPPRNLQTRHISKSHDSLHLSRNQSSSTITTMSKVLHLPRKLHFEVKKSTLEHQKHEVSLAPATKSDHQIPKCARHHNESAVARSTRRRQADFASLRSRATHSDLSTPAFLLP